MNSIDRQAHWNNIYKIKKTDEMSWYQPSPATSFQLSEPFQLPESAKIIDIGGGDSLFADKLIDMGYKDITVLDISENAIERSRQRLIDQLDKVKWVVSDALDFMPAEKYDLWHDRATFHFLTDDREIEKYLEILRASIKPSGYLVIGTFSDQGPEKCSGLDIKQYSEQEMTKLLQDFFEKITCIHSDHKTPSGSIQNFIFCSFRVN